MRNLRSSFRFTLLGALLLALTLAWAQDSPIADEPIEPPQGEEPITCFSCPPGFASTRNCSRIGNETICPSGHCMTGYNCSACLQGQFSNKFNSSRCSSCLPGTFSPVSANKCATCARGYVCFFNPVTNSTIMKTCPPGFYCPEEGMSGGYSCPVAAYCPDFGMTAPRDCPKGYYCPSVQTTIPTLCDAGFYCPAESSAPLSCSFLLSSQAGADGCYPTAGMYILIVSSALIVIGIVAWLWLRSSARRSQPNSGAMETASLIPEPEGPKYTGL